MLKSIFGGLCIAFGAFASCGLPKPLNGIIFSIGLFLIIFFSFSLFTGNVLKLSLNGIKEIFLKDLLLVYFGNFIGCFIFASLIFCSGLSNETLIQIGQTKASLTWMEAFLRAIPCNILVCMAVYLAKLMVTDIARIAVIVLPITLFVISGFEHCVANMFYYTISGTSYINLIPVTLGNIIGGILVILAVRRKS